MARIGGLLDDQIEIQYAIPGAFGGGYDQGSYFQYSPATIPYICESLRGSVLPTTKVTTTNVVPQSIQDTQGVTSLTYPEPVPPTVISIPEVVSPPAPPRLDVVARDGIRTRDIVGPRKSTGAQYAQVVTTDTENGDWSLKDAIRQDASSAFCTTDDGLSSDIKGAVFDFQLLEGATITGIKVVVKRRIL